MSRIRTIKPEFWTSEQVMECSPLARLLFIGLWNFCDDQGVHPASPKTLKAEVFPGDDITTTTVQDLVQELLDQRLVATFTAKDKCWWYVTGWRHQLITRPSAPKYPSPHGGLTEPSLSPHGVLTEDSTVEGKGREYIREGNGREGSTDARRRATHTPKTALPSTLAITPELQALATQHGYQDLERHLEHFRDKATAKGYQYADWTAALRTAIRDDLAGLRRTNHHHHHARNNTAQSPEGARFTALLNTLNQPAIEGELADALH